MKPKYFLTQSVFVQKTYLHTSLYEAIRESFLTDSVHAIPTAWPDKGRLANTSPWTNWWVGYDYTHQDGSKGGIYCMAQFHDPKDAFAWAEEKQKRDGTGATRYVVRFMWDRDSSNKGGGTIELERMPANWLTEQRKAWDRAEKLRMKRAAARQPLAA